MLRVAGDGFRIHRTPHFLIAHDTPPGMVESLAIRLEQTYDSVTRFCERSGFATAPLRRRLEVIFFNEASTYAAYARPFSFNAGGTYGFYHQRTNRSAFFNMHNDPKMQELHASIQAARDNVSEMESTVKSLRADEAIIIIHGDGQRKRLTRAQAKTEIESIRKRIRKLGAQQQTYGDRINRKVVQHEVAHQTLFNNGVHAPGGANPKWLTEGLACMFETPPGAGGSGLSAVNQSRLKDFRDAIGGEANAKALNSGTYARAVADGRMVSLRELVQHPELFEARGEEGARHYAAAWALLHYLHRTQNKALSAYLQEVAGRGPGFRPQPAQEMALFEKHFGPLDDLFATRFSAFILSLPYRPYPDDRS